MSLQIFTSCVQIFTRISLRANVLRTCTFNCTVTMNTEPRVNQRELTLQRRRERDRVRRQSESAQQREERLRRRRVRDRARYAAQTTEQRLLSLQRRRDRLIGESTRQREARLQDLSAHQQRLARLACAAIATAQARPTLCSAYH